MNDSTDLAEGPAIAENVAPAAEQQPETVADETAPATTDASETSETEGKKPHWSTKRIDELTRDKYAERQAREAAEKHARYLEQQLARLQKPSEPVQTEKPATLPKLEDFSYDEAAYQAALLEHASKEAARKVREELKREESERQKQAQVKSWKQREAEFKAKTPDYEDVVYTAPISDAVADLIIESEIGAEVAYYLGKHPEEARQIAELDPVKAARAIGRIEAKLEKPPAPPSKPKPVSEAPPPPPRIEAVEPAVEKDPDQMSVGDWLKWRNKQLSRKKA